MDLETKITLLMIKEKQLNKREKQLNDKQKELDDLENKIKSRESGLVHYYAEFIDSLQEQSFRHFENHHYGCQLE
jgi:hypothetical protein